MRRGRDMRQLVAVLVAVFAASAFGQAFPTRPVTMIVPYAAGGSADVVARPVAAEMGKILGENVVVELRPGGGGNIGADERRPRARARTRASSLTAHPGRARAATSRASS